MPSRNTLQNDSTLWDLSRLFGMPRNQFYPEQTTALCRSCCEIFERDFLNSWSLLSTPNLLHLSVNSKESGCELCARLHHHFIRENSPQNSAENFAIEYYLDNTEDWPPEYCLIFKAANRSPDSEKRDQLKMMFSSSGRRLSVVISLH